MKKTDSFKFHPKCAKLQVVQLGFANDLLPFFRGDLKSVKAVFECFQKLSLASGLVSNLSRSSIYFEGVSQALYSELRIRYLGVLLSTKRLSSIQCQPLLKKMLQRVNSWTTKVLSYAGRV